MKAPEIRFKGEQLFFKKQLKEIATINPKNSLPDFFEYVDLESVVGTEMKNHRTEMKESAPSRAQRLASKGDIFFQTVRPYQQNNLYFDLDAKNFVFSTGYTQIRSKINSKYLFTILQQNNFLNQVLENCTGSSYPAINPSSLANLFLTICDNEVVQQKIASYFQSLDSLIQTTSKKLASLKQIKAASLQSMFPQEGETIPKVRFKGFEGEWKCCKLGDLGIPVSGIAFPEKEQGGKSGTPFFKVSDMNNEGNDNIMNTANNYVSNSQITHMNWKVNKLLPAIFFAKVGAAVLLNRKRLLLSPCLFDNNTMIFITDSSKLEAYFALCLFRTINLPSLVQIGTLPSYNGKQICSINASIPSYEEQVKIGNFFRNLDHQISLQTQRLEKLKQIKAACLDKMFV